MRVFPPEIGEREEVRKNPFKINLFENPSDYAMIGLVKWYRYKRPKNETQEEKLHHEEFSEY